MKTLARSRDKQEILTRLATLRADSGRRWGRMSAHQMVCHVSDSFRMGLGERPVSPASGPLQRTLVKWIAIWAPLPWPHGIPTRPEVEQGRGGTCPADFAADVADLTALLEQFTSAGGRDEWPPHPTFGRMSEAAWLRWGYRHMDHHLRQFGA